MSRWLPRWLRRRLRPRSGTTGQAPGQVLFGGRRRHRPRRHGRQRGLK